MSTGSNYVRCLYYAGTVLSCICNPSSSSRSHPNTEYLTFFKVSFSYEELRFKTICLEVCICNNLSETAWQTGVIFLK